MAQTQTEIAERAMALKRAAQGQRPAPHGGGASGGSARRPKPDGIERVRVRILPDGRLDRKNAAKYLGKAVKTLAEWHTRGKGPRSVLVGGSRIYYQADLDAYIAGELVTAAE